MSAKFEKKIRRTARYFYNAKVRMWLRDKPPRLCFFRYARWKKQEPRYKDIEKEVKKRCK